LLLLLAGLYCGASFGHFFHNAEYCGEYPNLPAWISRWSVYFSWVAITALGVAGLVCLRKHRPLVGLGLIAVYAALGFDGLGHYALAPMAAHSAAMNLSIWSEVVAAAFLLAWTLRSLVAEFRGLRAGAPMENA